MTIHFSEKAVEWAQNYHGSIDSTALLLAFDAGHREGQRWAAHVHDMADPDCGFFERPVAPAGSSAPVAEQRENQHICFAGCRCGGKGRSMPESQGSGVRDA
jgi:hypothetical protein